MYGIECSTNPDQMNNVIEYQVISSEDTTCENKVQILHNCTSCDAYFMDRDVLRRHIGLIHENKIPLECTYCYAVFIEHKKLTQHKVCTAKGFFFQKVIFVFQISQFPKKLLQKTIRSLKFEQVV